MQGQQDHQPQLFSMVQIESLIPKSHLLRKVDKVLDLSFIRSQTEEFYCANNGRPSIDPEVFVRILLIMHLYNIRSDRQVCEELQYNLAYRWFCKFSLEDKIPDHSSLTRIRDRLGEETFKKIFNQIVNLCMDKGLVVGAKVIVDGSLVDANASLYSLIPKDEFEKKEVEEKAYGRKQKHRKNHILGEKISNKTHISTSDPDARLAGKKGAPKRLRYKAHNTIDSESRVILDTHITDGAKLEGNIFQERLEQTEKEQNIKIKEVTADRGYGYGANLQYLEDKKFESFVPLFHRDTGNHLEQFKYDKENDRFECLAGHYLYPLNSLINNTKKYRIKKGECINCVFGNKCKAKKRMSHRGRSINVNIFHQLQGKVKEKEKTEIFKKKLSERMWKVEGIFAEAKNFHGLKRARYRGKNKMQIQAYMIGTVQNLKRLMNFILLWFNSFSPKISKNWIFLFIFKKMEKNLLLAA